MERGKKDFLFSIGHGARSLEEFVGLLNTNGIKYLADVRSVPYSKFHPTFNRETLSESLKSVGITYVFMGDNLGGRPQDRKCYNEEGKVDYALVSQQPFYLEGIKRLETANAKGIDLAIMCSELNPEDCHRCGLIGKTLLERDICVKHIVKKGLILSQVEVLNLRNKGLADIDLFSECTTGTSNKKYEPKS